MPSSRLAIGIASECSALPVTDALEWERLFSTAEHPHVTQSWAYGEAKQRAAGWRARRVIFDVGGWRPRRLAITRRGEPVAICQMLDKCLGGAAVASRVNRGPLFLGADPGLDVIHDVYRLLRDHATGAHRPLLLAPALPDSLENHHLLSDLGYRPRQVPGWCSDRVDLRLDEQELHRNLHKSWRRHVNRAHRVGVEFRVCESGEDLEWIIERHTAHAKEKQFAGMNPAFLKALFDAAPRESLLVAQVLLDGQRLGGTVCYRFGGVAEILIHWLGQEGRCANVGKYLDWCAALELKRRGCQWFDLGGKRPCATDQFKAGIGGTEYHLLNEWVAL